LLGGVCAGAGGNTKHTGVDYAVPSGSEVKAVCDGVVKIARTPSTTPNIWNRFTIIEHTNCGSYSKLYGYYGHIDASVITGQTVKRGDVIGKIASWRGNSHLHLGFATKYFSSGWGYQVGDPLQNGWINPASFFQ
jgi:murein DD-endopeptidase MepM/ murein hydrolase activator NlpD